MKKIILSIIFIFVSNLAFASDCKQRSKNSAFVFFDGKKITIKSGMKIDDPQNKIFISGQSCGGKVAGHYLISRSCFEYYIPQITDYIASRL